MRFMMMVKANKDSEAGVMPDEKLISAMMKYNEEMTKAGVLVDLSGLQPTSKGARIKFSGGKCTVIDGPFTGTDLIAGYWLIKVKSREEAIDWAKRAPAPFGEDKEGEIELRQDDRPRPRAGKGACRQEVIRRTLSTSHSNV